MSQAKMSSVFQYIRGSNEVLAKNLRINGVEEEWAENPPTPARKVSMRVKLAKGYARLCQCDIEEAVEAVEAAYPRLR